MNKEQKEMLASYTCHILDSYPDMEEYLKEHGIPKEYIEKMNEAFNLIFEVNQCCFKKK